MKKRFLVGLVTIASLFILASSVFAWFAHDGKIINKFTAGSVEIEINEQGFVDLDKVKPGESHNKEVSIISWGSKQTYVRVALIPQWDPIDLSSHLVGWNIGGDWIDGGDGWYYYKHILKHGQETSQLISQVSFDLDMGQEYDGAVFSLLVKAEAVQASHEAYKDVWGDLPSGVETWPSTP